MGEGGRGMAAVTVTVTATATAREIERIVTALVILCYSVPRTVQIIKSNKSIARPSPCHVN